MKKVKIFVTLLIAASLLFFIRTFIFAGLGAWNEVWNSGGEATIGLVELILVIGGMYYYFLPDYIAVAFHDGKKWLAITSKWSDRKDFELFAKSECGILFGRFVKDNEVRLPRIPNPKILEVKLFGSEAGIYRIIPVLVTETGLAVLEAKQPVERIEKPAFEFQQEDEGLPLV